MLEEMYDDTITLDPKFVQCLPHPAYFPKAWRRAKVIALRKPGKDAYDTPRAYRPISLLSSVGKILETLMNNRIMRRLERQHALTPFQFGFRAGKEVLDACTRLVHDIVAALRRRAGLERPYPI